MEKGKPKSLENLVSAAEAENKRGKRSQEKKERELARTLKETNHRYQELKSASIAGVLMEKAPLVEKMFPTLVIHGEPPYYHDGELKHPRLVLSVVLRGLDYPSLRGNPGIRTIKYLGIDLDENGLVKISHFYRVPTRVSGGRWGNPYNFYWETKDWTPNGIAKEQFQEEIDPLLTKFCKKYRKTSLREQETTGFRIGPLTFIGTQDYSQDGRYVNTRGRYPLQNYQILYPQK